jgi:hypothetical protein
MNRERRAWDRLVRLARTAPPAAEDRAPPGFAAGVVAARPRPDERLELEALAVRAAAAAVLLAVLGLAWPSSVAADDEGPPAPALVEGGP